MKLRGDTVNKVMWQLQVWIYPPALKLWGAITVEFGDFKAGGDRLSAFGEINVVPAWLRHAGRASLLAGSGVEESAVLVWNRLLRCARRPKLRLGFMARRSSQGLALWGTLFSPSHAEHGYCDPDRSVGRSNLMRLPAKLHQSALPHILHALPQQFFHPRQWLVAPRRVRLRFGFITY